ncbi:HupE/UreJ family protein [Psychroflexus montanilacus]|uniref:HupE/UreJ family protein n=1 Tax=Psychroflexus montanilacus TaxID=2873598 RepID=UPI001CCCD784|nr:HupE/UreJ family protein [Psychroflexus montanilacus]MBZ9652760.1 HupE/UreJ family protein [Psychroflexus montanilacus]
MEDFWLYLKLGFDHVLDWNAYDHVLFLTVLVASYSFQQSRKVVWLVTLFTIGHVLSLALSAYNILRIESSIIEFLIPVSIIFTAVYNIFTAGKAKGNSKINLLYFVTFFFGLVHGFGFSTYFNMLAKSADNIFLMLVEFALGIELAQILVVFVVLLVGFIVQNIFRFSKRDWVLVISSIVLGMTIPILAENWIF